MPGPFKKNLLIYQGATFDEVVTWKVGEAQTPVNLTGCTARAHVRSVLEDTVVLMELTTSNGRIELGGTTGIVRLLISATDTAAINWTEAVYDLEIVFADGTVRRLLAGNVKVSPEVTRV
jgi:hypothetical protein